MKETLLSSLILILLLTSCKKEDKDHPISFQIKTVMPYDSTPIAGLKYVIQEYKAVNSLMSVTLKPTDWKMEGTIGETGMEAITFLPKKNKAFKYKILFDYSTIELPSTDFWIVDKIQNDVILRSNENKPYSNVTQQDYSIHILPKATVHYKYENVNCLNANDKMHFFTVNIDQFPDPFIPMYVYADYFNGCGVTADFTSQNVVCGRHLYKIEVVKNGISTYYLDTFLVVPNVTNEIFINY